MWVGNVNLTYKTDAEEEAAGDTLIQTDSPSHRQSIGVMAMAMAMAISMQYQEQQAGGEKKGSTAGGKR